MKKVRGRKVVTTKANEEIFDLDLSTIDKVTYVQIQNMGSGGINVIVNKGDELYLEPGETLSLGDITVKTIVVVESGSTVRFVGVNEKDSI